MTFNEGHNERAQEARIAELERRLAEMEKMYDKESAKMNETKKAFLDIVDFVEESHSLSGEERGELARLVNNYAEAIRDELATLRS
jgi:uncharacterized coiled-coil protein SlyX